MNPMKIFIDCTDLLKWEGNYTGIQTVSINLIKEALLMFSENCSLVRYDDEKNIIATVNPEKLNITVNYKNKPQELIFDDNSNFPKDAIFLITGGAWNNLNMLDLLIIHKKKHNLKVYSLIYDLIPFIVPYNYQSDFPKIYKKYLTKIINLSDNILPISQSTKNDLLTYISHSLLINKKINVIRLGDRVITKLTKNKPAYSDKFILSVGTFEVRKNYQIIYRAYKYAQLINVELPKIIIVGRKGTLVNDLLEIISNDKSVENKIIIKNDVKDNELNKLFQECLFTIYPSIYEGWGIPIAESMIYGKACIASKTSSMVEIAGDLVDYFNPYNEKQLFELIQKYSNDNIRLELEKRIIKNYHPTTWKNTLIQMLK